MISSWQVNVIETNAFPGSSQIHKSDGVYIHVASASEIKYFGLNTMLQVCEKISHLQSIIPGIAQSHLQSLYLVYFVTQ